MKQVAAALVAALVFAAGASAGDSWGPRVKKLETRVTALEKGQKQAQRDNTDLFIRNANKRLCDTAQLANAMQWLWWAQQASSAAREGRDTPALPPPIDDDGACAAVGIDYDGSPTVIVTR
ncbi:MAG: hypothetical protein ACM33U_09015 [Solirubrobacterales bacterium]|nr:hypothetical protein [Solirubrobacterales bacterium]